MDVIAERAPRTLVLFITATVLAYYVGFLIGKLLAWRRGGTVEYAVTVGGVALYTVFLPWFALMMIWLFAYTLGLFPIGKFLDPVLWRSAPVDANYVFFRMLFSALIASLALFFWYLYARRLDPARRSPALWLGVIAVFAALVIYWATTGVAIFAADILRHLILPILTLTLVNFAGVMLLTRSSMLETLREDYIMAARAKGLPEPCCRLRHPSYWRWLSFWMVG
jgi:peptide/nickel transport system permease protein